MKSLVRQIPGSPFLYPLLGMVGLGVAAGVVLIVRNLRNDPTLVITNKRENPFPFLAVTQDRNIKLYAVNQKFEKPQQ